MNKKAIILLSSIIWINGLYAQVPAVPDRIQFADIELKLTNYARNEIQMDVNAFHRNPKYFNMKLARVNQYFPIVERVLKEENLPDDFKYLVIQESALISDAVSSSNAVGFWQFKKATGLEVGLRIDNQIDERKNIVSSTRGASKYIKKHNFYLKNWLYSLSAYQAGLGGVKQYTNEKYKGAKKMEINKQTHWYVKKYLAHRIAFQDYIGREIDDSKVLYEYTKGGGKTIKQIAIEFDVDSEILYQFNKWIKSGRIPVDRIYTVIIPGYQEKRQDDVVVRIDEPATEYSVNDASLYPVIKSTKKERNLKINGLPGLIALEGEDIYDLIKVGGLDLTKFIKYNDIDISHRIEPGQVYYLKKKKGKAKEYYHIANPGENLWYVSQKYGIRRNSLLNKNRMKETEQLKEGRVLWMRYIRPEDSPIEYREISQKKREYIPDIETEAKNMEVIPSDHEHQPLENSDHPEALKSIEEESRKPAVLGSDNNRSNDILEKGMPEEYLSELDKEQDPKLAFHIVDAHETLYGLSKKYEIGIDDLLKWNDLEISDGIKIGQKIYLSKPYFQIDEVGDKKINVKPNKNHTVQKGETMYSISRKYDVTVEQLKEWNNKLDFSIKEGDILIIGE